MQHAYICFLAIPKNKIDFIKNWIYVKFTVLCISIYIIYSIYFLVLIFVFIHESSVVSHCTDITHTNCSRTQNTMLCYRTLNGVLLIRDE